MDILRKTSGNLATHPPAAIPFFSPSAESASLGGGRSIKRREEIRSLCNVALLSVTTRSNRAAVAGNCSSLLPGAPPVQSRIHEFLVCSLPYAPSSPTSLHLRSCPRGSPGPPRRVCRARGEYPAHDTRAACRRRRAKEIARDVNRRQCSQPLDHRKCKVRRFRTTSRQPNGCVVCRAFVRWRMDDAVKFGKFIVELSDSRSPTVSVRQ